LVFLITNQITAVAKWLDFEIWLKPNFKASSYFLKLVILIYESFDFIVKLTH